MKQFVLILILICCVPYWAEAQQKGINFTSWLPDQYSTPESNQSLRDLSSTGADWVCILVTIYQDDIDSTDIYSEPTLTPTDTALEDAITEAHNLGLNVMMRVHVDLADDPTHWRGQIGTNFNGGNWNTWFSEYEAFITAYAELAEDNDVEQFVVGTELSASQHREDDWRDVIDAVRSSFSGDLTYAANHDAFDSIAWWDDLDYIGIDAYFNLTALNDPTLAQLEAAWVSHVSDIADISSDFGDMPVLFTEIGYRSCDGANKQPWKWGTTEPYDGQEQADCYQALFNSVWDEAWFEGMFLWNWDPNPRYGGSGNIDYTPQNKPALVTLSEQYHGYEPNDSMAEAAELTLDEDGYFEAKNLLLEGGEEDWYKIEINQKSRINVILSFGPGHGSWDLDIYIKDKDGNNIAQGTSGGYGEYNEFVSGVYDPIEATEYIYFRITYGYENKYDIKIHIGKYATDISVPAFRAMEMPAGQTTIAMTEDPLYSLLESGSATGYDVTYEAKEGITEFPVGPTEVIWKAWSGTTLVAERMETVYVFPHGQVPVGYSYNHYGASGNHGTNIVRTADGTVHMAWIGHGEDKDEDEVKEWIFYCRAEQDPDTGEITSVTAPEYFEGNDDDWASYVAMASYGNTVHFAWHKDDGNDVYYRRLVKSGSDWVWEDVQDTGAQGYSWDCGPDIAVHSETEVHIVSRHLQYASCMDVRVTDNWNVEVINPDTEAGEDIDYKYPSIAVDLRGDVHIVFTAIFKVGRTAKYWCVWYMHKDRDTGTWIESHNALHKDGGSPWNDPGTTTDYVVAGDWIEIVADMAGNLHLGWHGTVNTGIPGMDDAFYMRRPFSEDGNDQGWEEVITLHQENNDKKYSWCPSICVDSDRGLAIPILMMKTLGEYHFENYTDMDTLMRYIRDGDLRDSARVNDDNVIVLSDVAAWPASSWYPTVSRFLYEDPHANEWLDVFHSFRTEDWSGTCYLVYQRKKLENNRPEAMEDTYSTAQDTELIVDSVTGILVNDSDPDEDDIQARLVSDVSDGDLVLNKDGSFTYMPDSGFCGTDTFTYETNDWFSESSERTVFIVVEGTNSNAPVLSWTGETAYTSDGLDPENGDSKTEFVFRVEYTDLNNNFPMVKLHIDKNGDGDCLDDDEVLDMTIDASCSTSSKRDRCFLNGEWYTVTSTIPCGADTDNCSYYFSADDGIYSVSTSSIDAPDILLNIGEGPGDKTIFGEVGGAPGAVYYSYKVTKGGSGTADITLSSEHSWSAHNGGSPPGDDPAEDWPDAVFYNDTNGNGLFDDGTDTEISSKQIALGSGEEMDILAKITILDSVDYEYSVKTLITAQYNPTSSIETNTWVQGSLYVKLAGLKAEQTKEGVLVSWVTLFEADNIGFNVYMRDTEKEFIKANQTLIPSQYNGNGGAKYSFLISGLTADESYQFAVEDVDVYGKRTMHGPVRIGEEDDNQGQDDEGEDEEGFDRDDDLTNSNEIGPGGGCGFRDTSDNSMILVVFILYLLVSCKMVFRSRT